MNSENPHVVPAIIVTENGKTEIAHRISMPASPASPEEEKFWKLAVTKSVEVSSDWIKLGDTGYLDQVKPEDFPKGACLVMGEDEHGRQFISFRFKAYSYITEKDSVGAMTLFRRYSGGEGPWVSGGRHGIEFFDRISISSEAEERDHETPFNSVTLPSGFHILHQLVERGVVNTARWSYSKKALVPSAEISLNPA